VERDKAWHYHMGRMFARWAKDAETDEERENCLRLSAEFRSVALLMERLPPPESR
jgi:hypothetical protein